MVEEPRLCIEILQQLAAAEAALNRISLAVLRWHVEKCVPDGIAKGEAEGAKRLNELVDIFDRFAK
jgi:DNA-binding FrmR family transcriptional regulator